MASKKPYVSKVPLIKKIIQLDPEHPGTISKQRLTLSNGKKSKFYYLWQSSKVSKKQSYRLQDSEAAQIKAYIAKLQKEAKADAQSKINTLDVLKKSLDQISDRNKEIKALNDKKEKEEEKSSKKR
jgi:ATPase subunit of ABC transporter with duplicated ATPase domains